MDSSQSVSIINDESIGLMQAVELMVFFSLPNYQNITNDELDSYIKREQSAKLSQLIKTIKIGTLNGKLVLDPSGAKFPNGSPRHAIEECTVNKKEFISWLKKNSLSTPRLEYWFEANGFKENQTAPEYLIDKDVYQIIRYIIDSSAESLRMQRRTVSHQRIEPLSHSRKPLPMEKFARWKKDITTEPNFPDKLSSERAPSPICKEGMKEVLFNEQSLPISINETTREISPIDPSNFIEIIETASCMTEGKDGLIEAIPSKESNNDERTLLIYSLKLFGVQTDLILTEITEEDLRCLLNFIKPPEKPDPKHLADKNDRNRKLKVKAINYMLGEIKSECICSHDKLANFALKNNTEWNDTDRTLSPSQLKDLSKLIVLPERRYISNQHSAVSQYRPANCKCRKPGHQSKLNPSKIT